MDVKYNNSAIYKVSNENLSQWLIRRIIRDRLWGLHRAAYNKVINDSPQPPADQTEHGGEDGELQVKDPGTQHEQAGEGDGEQVECTPGVEVSQQLVQPGEVLSPIMSETSEISTSNHLNSPVDSTHLVSRTVNDLLDSICEKVEKDTPTQMRNFQTEDLSFSTTNISENSSPGGILPDSPDIRSNEVEVETDNTYQKVKGKISTQTRNFQTEDLFASNSSAHSISSWVTGSTQALPSLASSSSQSITSSSTAPSITSGSLYSEDNDIISQDQSVNQIADHLEIRRISSQHSNTIFLSDESSNVSSASASTGEENHCRCPSRTKSLPALKAGSMSQYKSNPSNALEKSTTNPGFFKAFHSHLPMWLVRRINRDRLWHIHDAACNKILSPHDQCQQDVNNAGQPAHPPADRAVPSPASTQHEESCNENQNGKLHHQSNQVEVSSAHLTPHNDSVHTTIPLTASTSPLVEQVPGEVMIQEQMMEPQSEEEEELEQDSTSPRSSSGISSISTTSQEVPVQPPDKRNKMSSSVNVGPNSQQLVTAIIQGQEKMSSMINNSPVFTPREAPAVPPDRCKEKLGGESPTHCQNVPAGSTGGTAPQTQLSPPGGSPPPGPRISQGPIAKCMAHLTEGRDVKKQLERDLKGVQSYLRTFVSKTGTLFSTLAAHPSSTRYGMPSSKGTTATEIRKDEQGGRHTTLTDGAGVIADHVPEV